MRLLQHGDVRVGQRPAGLPQQGGHKQPTTHPDPAVDPPYGQVNVQPGERGTPGDHMLVHAVDERAVQVK